MVFLFFIYATTFTSRNNIDFVSNDKVVVKYGELRPNLYMHGVYAVDSFEEGEFIFCYANYIVRAASNFTNMEMINKYAWITYINNGEYFISPRFSSHGPELPNNAQDAQDVSFGVFMNEPSPNIVSFIYENEVLYGEIDTENAPNVCGLPIYNTVVMFALRYINEYEELTVCYADDYLRDYSVSSVCSDEVDVYCREIFLENLMYNKNKMHLLLHSPTRIEVPLVDSFVAKTGYTLTENHKIKKGKTITKPQLTNVHRNKIARLSN